MVVSDQTNPPIAIVGISALFPSSVGPSGFWQNIVDGQDLITDVPASHWLIEDYFDPEPGDTDKTYCKRGGFLPDIDFDPVAYGIPPTVIPATDTAQLLALILAKQVLEDAFSEQFSTMDKEKMSIILGVTAGQELLIQGAARLQRPQWLAALREEGVPEDQAQQICDRIADKYTPWQENTFPGLLGNVVAGRIANRFDLGGTNAITDAACASSLSALSMAINELQLGHSDVVITGGVDCFNDIFMFMCFTKTPALSRTGDCRPFADGADGTLMGEGIGMFALKRLADAEADGDKIYALIRGLGSSSDGRSLSVYAPLPEGQAKAISRAHERAGVDPKTIELVEAHGTGTKAGDVAEFEGLKLAFQARDSKHADKIDEPWCALGSVKSQIGHTKAAAGAAGLFKAVMALHHKTLPPTIKVERPNPRLPICNSPFYINTETRPWIRGSDHPRRAGLSSFGFGGSNFHIVLEEYQGQNRPVRQRTLPAELLLFSSITNEKLARSLKALTEDLQNLPERPEEKRALLSYLARESQKNFDAEAAHRLSITTSSLEDLQKTAKACIDLINKPDAPEFELPQGAIYRNQTRITGKLAMLFPGQGSQYVGMGKELAMHFDRARQIWDKAADLDFALHKKVFPPPVFSDQDRKKQQEELTQTEWAQPAIGADSAAKLAILNALNLQADAFAGHSYGEVTALYAAGVFDEETMLRIARRRGELMAEAAASTQGAMTAVRASAKELKKHLKEAKLKAVIANDNSPRQVVLSGPVQAIEEAEAYLKSEKIAFHRLPVATAFHSSVVAGATAPFRKFLEDLKLKNPALPVWANATAKPYKKGAASTRKTLSSQIEKPVRFVEMLQSLYDDGVRTFVEVGPGSVLTGLAKACLADQDGTQFITLDRRSKEGITAFFEGLGQLATLGAHLQFDALWENYGDPEDPRTKEKSKFTVSINGANVGRPYPPKEGAAGVPPPNPPKPKIDDFNAKTTPSHGQNNPGQQQMTNTKASPATYPPANGSPRQQAPAQQPQPQPATPQAYPVQHSASHAQAFALYQQTLAQSHMAYLRLMEQSVAQAQMAYMQAMESSFRQWATGDASAPAFQAPQPMPSAFAPPMTNGATAPNLFEPSFVPQPAPAPQPVPAPQPAPLAQPAPVVQPAPVPQPAPAPQPVPVAPPAPVAPPTPAAQAAPPADMNAVMLKVVAEKTGYPEDMLDPSMALEADLGIDSIKRVEILSAVQSEVPGLPELDPGEMASLKTLGEITDYLTGLTGGPSASTPAPVPQTSAPAPTSAAPPIADIFLTVVAEKTGYPEDMLDTSMALEADLGIDSIKRVEILSAVQSEVPTLPDLDPGEMASLKTVGDIVGYLENLSGTATQQGGLGLGKPEPSTALNTRPARFAPRLLVSPSAELNSLTASPITILDDEQGVAQALAKLLAEKGYIASIVDSPADTKGARQVIDLRGLPLPDSINDALELQKSAFQVARSIADDVETYLLVFDTGGSFGLDDSTQLTDAQSLLGGLAALAKTAALEWPTATVKALDLATPGLDPKTLAARIFNELQAGGPQVEVAYSREGTRFTVESIPTEPPENAQPTINSNSIILATGGARGVTAHSLIELARRHQPTVILFGRTALKGESASTKAAQTDAELKRALLEEARKKGEKLTPAELGKQAAAILREREVRHTLSELERAGSSAHYIAADARDSQAMQTALAEVRARFGPPTAIVHAAGVLADKFIKEKTDDQFDFVFDTKVEGLFTLLEATKEDPIQSLCLFSSVAARTGNVGQVDYAMANESLNKFAAQARRKGLDAVALGWGPWDGGMVDASLRAHFEARGVKLIDLDGGAQAFCDEFAASHQDSAEVVLGDGLLEAAGTYRQLISFDAISHPYLAGHQIDGTVVVPATEALSTLTALARSLKPALYLKSITDFQVLKGITLPDFKDLTKSTRFLAIASPTDAENQLLVELRALDGTVHYRAFAQFTAEKPGITKAFALPKDLGESRFSDNELYEKLLFHADDFAVLKNVEGLGQTTARSKLSKPLTNQTIILDAGLQLALVQGIAHKDRSNLPTALKSFTDYGLDQAQGPIEIVARTSEITNHRTVTDLQFRDASNRLLATIEGLQMYFRGEPVV